MVILHLEALETPGAADLAASSSTCSMLPGFTRVGGNASRKKIALFAALEVFHQSTYRRRWPVVTTLRCRWRWTRDDSIPAGTQVQKLTTETSLPRRKIMRLLLQYGADPSLLDLDGNTPVQHAENEFQVAIQELIDTHQAGVK